MRILKILFLTILAASNHVVFAQKISGIASHIYDGDTFRLKKSNGDLVQIRLANIDAPELEQTHGIASREYLQKMLKGNEVVVDIQDIDKYGRTVGIVFSNNININDASVANGHAWHYWRYSKNINICKIENMAKRNKIGLWADPNPTPPWEYRERRKTLQTSPKFRQSNPFKDYVDHSEEIVDSIIKNRKYLN